MSDDLRDNIRIGRHSPLIPSRTHTYAKNTAFYATVPHPFQQYYMRHVRNWLQWYDGYVDWFHTADPSSAIFSTRLAYTVLHKLARLTVGRKILFDDAGEKGSKVINMWGKQLDSLSFAEKWSEKNELTDKVKKAVEWAYAAGDSILKLDNLSGGRLTVSPHRKDTYFYDTNVEGDVTAASLLVYTLTNIIPDPQGEKKELFYLFEERKYDDNGTPLWRLSIKKGTGHTLSHKSVDFQSADEAFRDCPKHIREKLIKEYPRIQFNEWMKLPFKDLGLIIVKANEGVSFMPSLPFGESLLSNTQHILMSYDFYYTAKNTDIYLGRGKLMIPQHLQNPQHELYDEGDFRGWDTFLMQKIPYTDPDQQKPIPLQFDLRADEWERVRNNLFQELATSIGISERTIATYAVPASEKPSAYEISSDEDATAAFVEDKRDTLTNVMNKLVENVLDFYNFGDEKVYVKFSKVGLTNQNNILNSVMLKRQNHLISLRTALEELYPDWTESKIDREVERIKEETQEKQEFKQDDPQDNTLESEQTQQFREMSTLRQTKEE